MQRRGGLLRVVKDQIEERGVATIVSNKESTNWRKSSVKTLIREKQLTYTDVEEMGVMTNDRHGVGRNRGKAVDKN